MIAAMAQGDVHIISHPGNPALPDRHSRRRGGGGKYEWRWAE